MKKLIKNIIYKALFLIKPRGAVILMYHSIAENDKFFTVAPKDFEKQMCYLKEKKINVVKLADIPSILKNKISPKKIIVITFDDGYEDNYLNAAPILKKFEFPATIFINTARLGKNENNLQILSREQVQELSKNNLFDFGSHGHNHIKLTKLNENELEEEFKTSKQIIKDLAGKEAISLAYPYGNFDLRIEKIAGKYFEIACTIEKGMVKTKTKLLSLKRNSIDSAVSFEEFKKIVEVGKI